MHKQVKIHIKKPEDSRKIVTITMCNACWYFLFIPILLKKKTHKTVETIKIDSITRVVIFNLQIAPYNRVLDKGFGAVGMLV